MNKPSKTPITAERIVQDVAKMYSEESSSDMSWDSEAEITDLGPMEGASDWDIEEMENDRTEFKTLKRKGRHMLSKP